MPILNETLIRCDCPCARVIKESGIPYLTFSHFELREASVPLAGENLVFVGIDANGNPDPVAAFEHAAAYLANTKVAAKDEGVAVIDGTPDAFKVAHFAVQDLAEDELAATLRKRGKDADAWQLAAREEVARRLEDGRLTNEHELARHALAPGTFEVGADLPKANS